VAGGWWRVVGGWRADAAGAAGAARPVRPGAVSLAGHGVCEDEAMKLFVTGGAGFIGSNYVHWVLANTDDEVTVFDALTYAGNLDNLRDVADDPRYSFVHGDIGDREAVATAMAGHDAVVHFAAESHVDRSIVDPDTFVRTNCGGTNVMCDVARRLEVERFVHISTDEVYGSIEEGSFTESDPLGPRSPYSASKAGSDLIALAYHETYGLPVVVTRSSNNFGPYQFPEKVIPLFVTNLLDGQQVPLYGDGLNVRDWCYVEDNCAGVDLVLRQGDVGEIYNIGAGNEVPNRELTERILALLGHGEEMIAYVADRLGHDRRYSIDTTKVRGLGWKPERQLDEALTTTVSWYTDNRWWWEPLKGGATS
jgi:dTDP-glucose 4,6-dehydratase